MSGTQELTGLPEPPATASRDTWVDFGVSQGIPRDEAIGADAAPDPRVAATSWHAP
jgi:hypothetical protein